MMEDFNLSKLIFRSFAFKVILFLGAKKLDAETADLFNYVTSDLFRLIRDERKNHRVESCKNFLSSLLLSLMSCKL